MQIKAVGINNAQGRGWVLFLCIGIFLCVTEFHSQAVDAIDVLFSLRLGAAFPEGFFGPSVLHK